MATPNEAPDGAFVPSPYTLGPADERETLLDTLNADCKRLRDLCWKMREFESRFMSDKDDFNQRMAAGNILDIQPLLDEQIEFDRREEEIMSLKHSIDARVEGYNRGKTGQSRIHMTTTAEGLPISVETRKKTPIWGC